MMARRASHENAHSIFGAGADPGRVYPLPAALAGTGALVPDGAGAPAAGDAAPGGRVLCGHTGAGNRLARRLSDGPPAAGTGRALAGAPSLGAAGDQRAGRADGRRAGTLTNSPAHLP